MAQENRNRLAEWVDLLRKQEPVVRQYAADWFAEVRNNPRLLWETAATRYAAYALAGLLLVWIGLGLANAISPVPNAEMSAAAVSADFHVVCTHRDCGHHFVIHREFGFDDFPVVCPKCKQESAVRARQCQSPTCQGRWIAPARRDGVWRCPHCGQELP